MSTNIIAILLGILIIAVFLGYRVRWKKKQEKFREELIERFGQEDESGQENGPGQEVE